MFPFIIIAVVVIVIIAFVAIGSFNSLVNLKNRVREAASDIDVQLKRRYDLIPNLISTVKGSAKFESETLEKVIQARNSAMSITGLGEDKMQAENALSGTLKNFSILAPAIPAKNIPGKLS